MALRPGATDREGPDSVTVVGGGGGSLAHLSRPFANGLEALLAVATTIDEDSTAASSDDSGRATPAVSLQGSTGGFLRLGSAGTGSGTVAPQTAVNGVECNQFSHPQASVSAKDDWPDDVLSMGIRELNRFLKSTSYSEEEIKGLKRARRRKLNRLYAQVSRRRRSSQPEKQENSATTDGPGCDFAEESCSEEVDDDDEDDFRQRTAGARHRSPSAEERERTSSASQPVTTIGQIWPTLQKYVLAGASAAAVSPELEDEDDVTVDGSEEDSDHSNVVWAPELLSMSCRNLNRYVRDTNMPTFEVNALKLARRRELNRVYAKKSREKRRQQTGDASLALDTPNGTAAPL